MSNEQVEHIGIVKVKDGCQTAVTDHVAVEEPLAIELAYSTATGKLQKRIAVTMRTPGHDKELAAGFLFTEGIITADESIEAISAYSHDENRLLVSLKENVKPVLQHAERNFYATSSCGICGKASLDAIRINLPFARPDDYMKVEDRILYSLQEEMKKKQAAFESTGGIHASALFSDDGKLLLLREDVGRHNALDKLIGQALLEGILPLNRHILLLSGRASFELLQKAAMAGIRFVVAVGAPSSLAVEAAKESGITLAGFLRNGSYNLYTGFQPLQV